MKIHSFVIVAVAAVVSGCSSVSGVAQSIASRIENKGIGSAAESAPFLYLSSYDYGSGNLKACLENAQEALRSHGFTDNQTKDVKADYGAVGADNPDGKVAAIIECDMTEGRTASTSFAVSSMDNDKAYELYSKLNDAKW